MGPTKIVTNIADDIEMKLQDQLLAVGHGNLSDMELSQVFLADKAEETWNQTEEFFTQSKQQDRFDDIATDAFFRSEGDPFSQMGQLLYMSRTYEDISIITAAWESPEHSDRIDIIVVTVERDIKIIPTVINIIETHKPASVREESEQVLENTEYNNNSDKTLEDGTENNQHDPETVLKLAEEYLGQNDVPSHPQLKRAIREQIATWNTRLEDVDKNDPLRDKLQSEIAAKEEKYAELERREQGPKIRLLKAIEAEFVADGFWLDKKILRSINFLLFGKVSDTVVVENIIVEPESDLNSDKVYTVSTTVRDLAQKERQSAEEYLSSGEK